MRKFECIGRCEFSDCEKCQAVLGDDMGEPCECLKGGRLFRWIEVKESEQLPRLTVKALKERGIRWPSWAKVAVVYRDGSGAFGSHSGTLVRNVSSGCFRGVSKDTRWMAIPGFVWDATDWQNSVVDKPADAEQELPKWCKVLSLPGVQQRRQAKRIRRRTRPVAGVRRTH